MFNVPSFSHIFRNKASLNSNIQGQDQHSFDPDRNSPDLTKVHADLPDTDTSTSDQISAATFPHGCTCSIQDSSTSEINDVHDQNFEPQGRRVKFHTPYKVRPRGKCQSWPNCYKCNIEKDCGMCIYCCDKSKR